MKIINLLIGIALLSDHVVASERSIEVKIRSIYDGDTIEILMPTLPNPLDKMSVRILGIDTPEKGFRAKCANEKDRADAARRELVDILKGHDTIIVKNFKWDKYGGRIDGDVYVDGVNVAKKLIEDKMARPYSGSGPKPDWCSLK